jgi:hypothetical protein
VFAICQAALETERRTRDRFRKLAADLPAGLEKDPCWNWRPRRKSAWHSSKACSKQIS